MIDFNYEKNGRRASQPKCGWGQGTKQAHPEYPEPDSPGTGWGELRTDADEMRRCFGVSQYDDSVWEVWEHPYPNCLNHDDDGGEWGHVGGTNWLGVGGKGAGKSTFGLYWTIRLMEVNNEAVLWRGVSNRSEWLPLAPWTTVFLPESVDLSARWMPEKMTEPNAGEPADLEEIVREVRYYDNPVDLNDQLVPGTFNVAYPDPQFSECEAIMRSSDYVGSNVTFTPLSEAEENEGTSVEHWWFAYFVARLEYGPWDWHSVIFDEVEDFAPESASNTGGTKTYDMVESLRKIVDQSRKFNLSIYFLGQNEADLHSKIRRTMQWRVDFPDEYGNRTDDQEPPLGFKDIPMNANMLRGQDAGHLLLWQSSNFTAFTADDIYEPNEFDGRWLKIAQNQDSTRARFSNRGSETGEVADD